MWPISALDNLNGALYSADCKMKNDDLENPFFEFDSNSLLCSGIIVDQIQAVFADPDMSINNENRKSHYAKFWAYMYAVPEFYAQNKDCPYEDPRQAAWAMLHGDVTLAWLRREHSQNRHNNYPEEEYVCEYEQSRYIRRHGVNYSRLDSWDAVQTATRGRALAFSEKGYMCLVPQCVLANESQGEWLLAILATCSVPILLQKFEDGSYQVVGSCFVQGWMEGEVLINTLGASNQKAFWAARQNDQKLRIV
jgi:hypothetical protein